MLRTQLLKCLSFLLFIAFGGPSVAAPVKTSPGKAPANVSAKAPGKVSAARHQMRPSHARVVIGNPNAPVGGTMIQVLDREPNTLNPLRNTDAYGGAIESYCFDSLLGRNVETWAREPALAEKWQVAKDGKSYTFWLRKDAKFHNGEPITAADVKFSFDAYNNPQLADATQKLFFENIDHVQILGPYEIKFFVKRKYFLNLDTISGMAILPKSAYGNPSNHMAHEIVGSGPYKLQKFEQGKEIILVRNPDWWGFNTPENKGYNKFNKIVFKIIQDQTAQLEAFKRGDLDFLGLQPEQYMKQTSGDKWGTTLFKQQAENSVPHRIGFIGLNQSNPLFKDKRVREALSLLYNREFAIQKFFYNKYEIATGPWYSKSPDADPNAKPYAYDPDKARQLLKAAGWADTNRDGILDKMINGQRVDFRFTVLNGGAPWDKYLTVYQEDLKKAGIQLNIKVIDWNSLSNTLDDGKFEAVAMAWGGVVEGDPKQIWESSSHTKGGSNFIGYSNPEVDRLIEKARQELNRPKRQVMMHKIYSLIANDYPYIFLWSPKYSLYAYDKKMHMVKPTYKYDIGTGTWWAQEN